MHVQYHVLIFIDHGSDPVTTRVIVLVLLKNWETVVLDFVKKKP